MRIKMKEESEKEIEKFDKTTKITIEEEAKGIVAMAFREPLEDIHAGEEMDIPENISRITQKEMKEIMKYAVDEVNFYLWLKKNRPVVYKWFIKFGVELTIGWDKPRNPYNMYREFIKKFKK